MLSSPQTIELDCPPGAPRPGDLFPSVIADTGLVTDDFRKTSMIFGNWTWRLVNKEKSELFEQVRRTTIKDRIQKLYESGKIRYGSW